MNPGTNKSYVWPRSFKNVSSRTGRKVAQHVQGPGLSPPAPQEHFPLEWHVFLGNLAWLKFEVIRLFFLFDSRLSLPHFLWISPYCVSALCWILCLTLYVIFPLKYICKCCKLSKGYILSGAKWVVSFDISCFSWHWQISQGLIYKFLESLICRVILDAPIFCGNTRSPWNLVM